MPSLNVAIRKSFKCVTVNFPISLLVKSRQINVKKYLSFRFFHLLFPQTEKAVELLGKFEAIAGSNLDMNEKYMKVLMNYSRDLESIRKLYQKSKQDPMIPRNLPPVAGKIAWARQLYRKIEGPMKVFKTKPEILKVN